MITGAVLSFFAAVVGAVLGIIPTIPVPSWLTSSGGAFSTVFQFADSMSPWFPVGLALTVGAALLAIKLAGFGIKVARMVISLMTGGGGSAA